MKIVSSVSWKQIQMLHVEKKLDVNSEFHETNILEPQYKSAKLFPQM